jgi:hypothetical protein
MTSIESTGGLYTAETKIVTGVVVSNCLQSTKTVQIALELAYERARATSIFAVVILP